MAGVKLMNSAEEIEQVFPVLSQLRPEYTLDSFMSQVARQLKQGYQLAALVNFNEVLSVAGFRVQENLAYGKFVYVDDLITSEKYRSQGCGRHLLSWLKQFARDSDCNHIHLDSSVTRHGAHRFYLQQRLNISGYHFYVDLGGDK